MSNKIKMLAVLTVLGFSSIEFVDGQASLSEEDFGKLNSKLDELNALKTKVSELEAAEKAAKEENVNLKAQADKNKARIAELEDQDGADLSSTYKNSDKKGKGHPEGDGAEEYYWNIEAKAIFG